MSNDDVDDLINVTICDGKYRVKQTERGLYAYRYGEIWQDLTGNNLVLGLVEEVEKLRYENQSLKANRENAAEFPRTN